MTTEELLARADAWDEYRWDAWDGGKTEALVHGLAAALRESEAYNAKAFERMQRAEAALAKLHLEADYFCEESNARLEHAERAEAALAAQEAACEVHCAWGEGQRERAERAEAALAKAWGALERIADARYCSEPGCIERDRPDTCPGHIARAFLADQEKP